MQHSEILIKLFGTRKTFLSPAQTENINIQWLFTFHTAENIHEASAWSARSDRMVLEQ